MLKQLNTLRPLFSRRDKVYYLLLLAMMGVGALLDVVGVGAVPAFVAMLAVPEKVMAFPFVVEAMDVLGITTSTQLVVWGCVGLILIFLLKNAYLAALYYLQIRITEIHRVRLSDRLFTAYMYAPYEFHLARNSAELLRNVQTETKEIITGIVNPVLNVTMGAMMTAGIVALLIAATPPFVLVGVAVVGGGSALFLRIFKKRLTRFGEEARHERKESIKAVNQGMSSIVDARILGRETYFTKEFHRSMAHFAMVDRLRQFISKSSPLVLESIAVLGLLIIVVSFAAAGADMVALVPVLALFAAAVVRLRSSIGQIVAGISQMQYSIAAVPLVVDDLALLEKPTRSRSSRVTKANAETRTPLSFEYGLTLDHVTYTYPGAEHPALHDVTLTIEKGMSVAFVGATGSGKTTLINLILGLLEPQTGSIAADGAIIHEHLAAWHASLGYIPQTINLLDDTIRRNIIFGLPDEKVDEERLRTAIRAAQLDDFIGSLEYGPNTVVGERGVRISGGQRQRIGLARALYHNPEVLLMDEATSALDNQTENLVMQALDELKEGRTFIMIAHRLSTVRKCDRLYFVRDGHIEAEGTYDELARGHQDFRRMAEVL